MVYSRSSISSSVSIPYRQDEDDSVLWFDIIITEFQSLIDKMRTIGGYVGAVMNEKFQSLIGKMRTICSSKK